MAFNDNRDLLKFILGDSQSSAAIRANDYKLLYKRLFKLANTGELSPENIGAVTDTLMLAGINVMGKLDNIPSACFYGVKANLNFDDVCPATCKTIGSYAFAGSGLSGEVNLPNTVETIGTSAFFNTKITKVTIPSGVKLINSGCFYKNAELEEVIFEDGCTAELDSYSFASCPKIKDITVPDTLICKSDYIFGNARVHVKGDLNKFIENTNGCKISNKPVDNA